MKVLICLSLLVALTAAVVPTCNKVVCGSPTDGNCASFASKTWTIKACDSGKHCSIKGENLADKAPSTTSYKCVDTPKAETPDTTVKKQIAGVACSSADGCFSGTCTDNYCAGLKKEDACVTWIAAAAAGDTSDDKKKVCGGNLYCKDAKCAEGGADKADCSADAPCAWPNVCVGTKCVAPLSLDAEGICASDLQCKADLFCKATKCAAADKDYEAGGAGHPCLKDDDCKPATCLDNCDISTDGSGDCGPAGDGYVSKKYVNARRTHNKDAKNHCDLLSGISPCYKPYLGEAAPVKHGDCYKDFKFDGGVLAAGTSSGFQLVLSMCMFFLYALF